MAALDRRCSPRRSISSATRKPIRRCARSRRTPERTGSRSCSARSARTPPTRSIAARGSRSQRRRPSSSCCYVRRAWTLGRRGTCRRRRSRSRRFKATSRSRSSGTALSARRHALHGDDAHARRARRPRLIVWPETVITTELDADPALFTRFSRSRARVRTRRSSPAASPRTATGSTTRSTSSRRDGTFAIYHKRQLVPFAEWFPGTRVSFVAAVHRRAQRRPDARTASTASIRPPRCRSRRSSAGSRPSPISPTRRCAAARSCSSSAPTTRGSERRRARTCTRRSRSFARWRPARTSFAPPRPESAASSRPTERGSRAAPGEIGARSYRDASAGASRRSFSRIGPTTVALLLTVLYLTLACRYATLPPHRAEWPDAH